MAIRLRTLDAEYHLNDGAFAADFAPSWRTTLEKRSTVSRLAGLREKIAKQARTDLQELCPALIDEAELEKFAATGLVEVCFTEKDTSAGVSWEIPWEFLLSAATQDKRNRTRPLLVLRHLAVETRGRSPFSEPDKLVVVKNNPGILGDLYTDNTILREQRNMVAHLSLDELTSLHNETLDSIAVQMRRNNPSVVHVTGVDSQQAREFAPAIGIPDEEALMVETSHGGIDPATAAKLCPALCAGGDQPVLVSLNFVNSACRIAPTLIRHGAGAVLSFFNDFDDIVAETFFANFYLGWRLARWNLLDAFRLAWSQIPSPTPERLWGTGLVFWCRESLIKREKERRVTSERRMNAARPSDSLRREFEQARETPILDSESKNIIVRVEPHAQLNYSLLHNKRSLFKHFFIRKPQCVGRLSNLVVEVVLGAGDGVPFRTREDLTNAVWMLQDEVHVPLISALSRSVRESIYTALAVRVTWNDRTIAEKTFRVSLLPIDHWQDDDANRKWLPSFVLPRDAAVGKIVDSAQRYLAAMSDNSESSFDAYLSPPEGVLNQVGAMWWALLNEWQITYTTSPPSYFSGAQRLRSPSQVVNGHRGTCIELALLFAACLESVDISPVIFLLERHALAGYYRDKQAHEKVIAWLARNARADSDPWALGAEFHSKLIEMLKTGEIVPLEMTWLTKRRPLKEAIAEGARRVESSAFQYFFDVRLARDSGVTPLPLVDLE